MSDSPSVTALVRRLEGVHDPVELHAALAASGRAPFLFRRTSGRAFLIVDRALSLEAKGPDGTLEALSEGGRILMLRIAARLGEFVVYHTPEKTSFAFTPCSSDDDDARLAHPTAFDILRAMLSEADAGSAAQNFVPLLAGVIGFDHVDMLEDLPPAAAGGAADIAMAMAETMVVIEANGTARIVAMAVISDSTAAHRQRSLAAERVAHLADRIATSATPALPDAASSIAEADTSDRDFAASVARLKEHVAAGDIFQCVPSRSFRAACDDPVAAFRRLVAADPSTYQFYADSGDGILLGASPETAVAVRIDGSERIVKVSPIAGTRPRGTSGDADDRMEVELRLDAKENAEHMMLVDLARNDIARVARPGSRRVTRLLAVERFARVMHLVSTVEGPLADGRDAIDALKC
ncbi:MAG: chorismate-binding protein, partial [Sphingomicrobium sp.]